jgi:hypothetical protein
VRCRQVVARAWLLLAEQKEWMDRQKRRERAKRPADALGNLRRAQMFSSAERSVPSLPPSDERVRDPALSPFRASFFAVAKSQIEPTAKLRNDTLLPLVSVGLRPWATSQTHPRTGPSVSRHCRQFHL